MDLQTASFQADTLLLVPEHLLLREGPATGHAVLVQEGRFADIGPREAVLARHAQHTPIELPGHLLMPGMIDAHHHLTQSFGKSLAYGEPSEIFRRVWVPLESSLNDEFVYQSAKLAALESLRGGFTTVCDAGTRAKGEIGAVARATTEAGLRCVLGMICNDGGNESSRAERSALRQQAERFLAQWASDPLVHPSLAISIPEAASDEMLTSVSAMCAEAGTVFQTHVNEHLAAVERSVVRRGLRPLELLARLGALGPQVLIAHGTLVTPSELMLLQRTDTAVSYNPVASAWKGNAVAPAHLMAELGIRFGLGTDSTRSDGFRLMDAAESAQKFAFSMAVGDTSAGAGWTWLDHATHDGASAIGLAPRIGEIAVGKEADFLLVDVDTPELCTSVDLVWDLVRLAQRDQIVASFVAGRLRLWRGWPLDWDARALMRQVAAVAHDAIASAPIQRLHPVAAEHKKRTLEAAEALANVAAGAGR
jgi:cytosine/adenosine deaminase-related metal-dependent hydrolase